MELMKPVWVVPRVNDIVGAETVANDIIARGADAIAISKSVEEGDKVAKGVVDHYSHNDPVASPYILVICP
ncbi:hypothetical protein EG328_000840 [Venturia inaequalis]|uniref:Uncharacterized protein n=1 Tax=Venturia inaequalis TaxID=5025 RepID=A0A8H3V1L6_VENIN|nr:hypothetical protein EG328_000840 [Venturia inaequalis]